ncbi:hypothetical protein BOTBODRAFT_367652 [Botryobasidium botryosum FD-172 SS1]|uniref:Uncharacterized protein n=1 Tax=Botryobasidium botryosum (strain FD-172 SS1) TaxID=930990 RepID=A0A067MG98_BOTB1|nr:hypothetical protein BOTBODRAFT_367652 [Botryobasidium botryosum FD-172 SS1]
MGSSPIRPSHYLPPGSSNPRLQHAHSSPPDTFSPHLPNPFASRDPDSRPRRASLPHDVDLNHKPRAQTPPPPLPPKLFSTSHERLADVQFLTPPSTAPLTPALEQTLLFISPSASSSSIPILPTEDDALEAEEEAAIALAIRRSEQTLREAVHDPHTAPSTDAQLEEEERKQLEMVLQLSLADAARGIHPGHPARLSLADSTDEWEKYDPRAFELAFNNAASGSASAPSPSQPAPTVPSHASLVPPVSSSYHPPNSAPPGFNQRIDPPRSADGAGEPPEMDGHLPSYEDAATSKPQSSAAHPGPLHKERDQYLGAATSRAPDAGVAANFSQNTFPGSHPGNEQLGYSSRNSGHHSVGHSPTSTIDSIPHLANGSGDFRPTASAFLPPQPQNGVGGAALGRTPSNATVTSVASAPGGNSLSLPESAELTRPRSANAMVQSTQETNGVCVRGPGGPMAAPGTIIAEDLMAGVCECSIRALWWTMHTQFAC